MAYTIRREPFATDAADAEEADTDGFVAPLRNAKGFSYQVVDSRD